MGVGVGVGVGTFGGEWDGERGSLRGVRVVDCALGITGRTVY